MKFNDIKEAPKTAVLAFGRMNPPTIGHKKLADKVASLPGDPFIFVSQSQKPKTDPLSFADKLKYAKASFPNVTVGSSDVKTIIQALQKIESMGYDSIIYVAGSDRIEDFTRLINQYNGKDYNFNKIDVVSAGERDPDAEGAEGMSASKMRAAAAAGDFDSFKQGVANPQIAQQMFTDVRKGMGVEEGAMKRIATSQSNKADRTASNNKLKPGLDTYKKKSKKVDELFGSGMDPTSVKNQDPNKIKVLSWIADRNDGKEHFLSFFRKGAAWSGKLIYIGPQEAKKFIMKYDNYPDYQDMMKKALTSVQTASKLFSKMGIKHAIRQAESVNEAYKLKLERGKDMDVLHITDTKTGGRTEVRGKPGYESGNYDSNDRLHMLLDKVGRSANISELINGEVVTINPKHPDATKAKAAADKAYKENFADGKVKGKSRPGRVKRAGASCNGSVTALRKRAKNSSGEKARMYHWCANMKSGRKKK